MKWIVPDYLPLFACRAGACRHTCCAGWEIDIDPETAGAYMAMPGELGKEIRNSVREEDGVLSFIPTGEEERCPFLNEEGLCRIILEKGPEALCQICTDHPRFRNFFSDREEMGLGLCCEAAAELILSRKERTEFVLDYEDEDREKLSEEEEALLSFRQGLLDLARDRSLPLAERVSRIAKAAELRPEEYRTPEFSFLRGLDLMDRGWADQLGHTPPPSDGADGFSAGRSLQDTPFEQLLVYLLFRHLPGAAEDGLVRERVAFCLTSLNLIRDLYRSSPGQTPETLWEVCRKWSAEIEYSDENLQAFLNRMI